MLNTVFAEIWEHSNIAPEDVQMGTKEDQSDNQIDCKQVEKIFSNRYFGNI